MKFRLTLFVSILLVFFTFSAIAQKSSRLTKRNKKEVSISRFQLNPEIGLGWHSVGSKSGNSYREIISPRVGFSFVQSSQKKNGGLLPSFRFYYQFNELRDDDQKLRANSFGLQTLVFTNTSKLSVGVGAGVFSTAYKNVSVSENLVFSKINFEPIFELRKRFERITIALVTNIPLKPIFNTEGYSQSGSFPSTPSVSPRYYRMAGGYLSISTAL